MEVNEDYGKYYSAGDFLIFICISSFAYKLASCLHLFADGEHIDLGRMETVEKNLEYGS